MDINSVKTWVDFLANKSGRGYITPDEFNAAILFAETMFVATRLGLPEDYAPGKATGQEAYPLTFKIEDDLRPYLKSLSVDVPITGVLPIPPDYLRKSSISSFFHKTVSSPVVTLDCDDADEMTTRDMSREVNVDVLFNNEFTDRKGHSYKGPTLEFPICTFYNYGIEFAPSNIGATRIDYISVPTGAKWGYDMVNEEPVYNPLLSTQLQCPQDCYSKITGFVLKAVGLNISSEKIAAAGAEIWSNGG